MTVNSDFALSQGEGGDFDGVQQALQGRFAVVFPSEVVEEYCQISIHELISTLDINNAIVYFDSP